MQTLEQIASILNEDPKEIERQGIKAYLKQRLRDIDVEIYKIAKKYGIKDIFDMDEKLKEGKFEEEDAREDYQRLDHLEFERDKIREALEKF